MGEVHLFRQYLHNPLRRMSVPQLRYSAFFPLFGKENVKRGLDGIGFGADESVGAIFMKLGRAPAMMVTCILYVCSLKND